MSKTPLSQLALLVDSVPKPDRAPIINALAFGTNDMGQWPAHLPVRHRKPQEPLRFYQAMYPFALFDSTGLSKLSATAPRPLEVIPPSRNLRKLPPILVLETTNYTNMPRRFNPTLNGPAQPFERRLGAGVIRPPSPAPTPFHPYSRRSLPDPDLEVAFTTTFSPAVNEKYPSTYTPVALERQASRHSPVSLPSRGRAQGAPASSASAYTREWLDRL